MSKNKNNQPTSIIGLILLIGIGVAGITQKPQTPTTAEASNLTVFQSKQLKSREELDLSQTQLDPNRRLKDDPTELPDPNGDPKHQAKRIEAFLSFHSSPLAGQGYGDIFVKYGQKYNRHPYAGVAIAFADSSLGKTAKNFNIGNTGMTDSACAVKCPDIGLKSWEQGIEDIFVVITNQNLKNATKLCHLSQGGWTHCPEGATVNGGKYYACSGGAVVGGICQPIAKYPNAPRSNNNWHKNTRDAFSWLMNKPVKEDWSITL